MHAELAVDILPQPDDATCGPTCLHAVYRYLDDAVTLEEVIATTPTLKEGGTLAVLLGSHALMRGYRTTIYTYNLTVSQPHVSCRSSSTASRAKRCCRDNGSRRFEYCIGCIE